MSTKNAVIALIVIVVLAGGLFVYKGKNPGPLPLSGNEEGTDDAMPKDEGQMMTRDEDAANSTTTSSTATTTGGGTSIDVGVDLSVGTGTTSTKTFTVNGSNFAFAPSTITVKKGDTVRIVFKNTCRGEP